jgi:cell division protein FtsB
MIRLTKSSLANIAGAVVVIYLAVILGQTIASNYHLQKQIDALNTQVSDLSIQNDELNYNLQYYATSSYQEKAARTDLGLQKPGENVIILPNPSNVAAQNAAKATKPKPLSNFTQWVDFLAGKS